MEENETYQITYQVVSLESDIRRLSGRLSVVKQLERPHGGPEDKAVLIELRKRCLSLMREIRPREKVLWISYVAGIWTESEYFVKLFERLMNAMQELDTIYEDFY